MEQIELCLLHVYSDSDFILQKAKKHTGHTSLGGQLLVAHPLCRRASPTCLPACLPACFSSPPLDIPWHGSGRPPEMMGTPGMGTAGAGEGAEEQCHSVGCSELV